LDDALKRWYFSHGSEIHDGRQHGTLFYANYWLWQYRKINKHFFLGTTSMIELKLYMNCIWSVEGPLQRCIFFYSMIRNPWWLSLLCLVFIHHPIATHVHFKFIHLCRSKKKNLFMFTSGSMLQLWWLLGFPIHIKKMPTFARTIQWPWITIWVQSMVSKEKLLFFFW
jgi:hypothetical protein